MKMKYGSVCSGVECANIAWKPLGWECVFVSEVEPFPCAVLQQRLDATPPIHPLDPNDTDDEKEQKMRKSWLRQINKLPKTGTLPNEGDFTKIGNKYEGKIDLLVGGTPCFAEGTMVLVPDGYVPIDSLKVGDKIISGSGKVQTVEAVGCKMAEIVKVFIGGRKPLICTPNHQFYCTDKINADDSDFKRVMVSEGVGKYIGGLPDCIADKVSDFEFADGTNHFVCKNRKSYIIERFENAGTGKVYNITVSEEHSYIAEGLWSANCQDLSIAGKRLGFEGKRSVLALDYIKLAYQSKCRWIVWENVPGALSANGGRDFSTFLSGLTGSKVDVPKEGFGNAGFVQNARTDRFGVAWRILDAQFTRTPNFPHAVPQRRRRIFLVGYFGDWKRAVQVLFEPEGLSRNPTPCRKMREEIAGDVRHCLETSGKPCDYWSTDFRGPAGRGILGTSRTDGINSGNTLLKTQDTVETLCASDYKFPQQQQIDQQKYVVENDKIVCRATRQAEAPYMNDCFPTLTAMAGMSENNQPFFVKESEASKISEQEKTYSISTCDANGTRKDRPNGGMYVYETAASKTLSTSGPNSETVVVKSFTQNTRDEVRYINGDDSIAGSLRADSGMKQTNYVVTEQKGKNVISKSVASTLNCHLGDKRELDNQHINEGRSLFVMEEKKSPVVLNNCGGSVMQVEANGNAETLRAIKKSLGADQYNFEVTGDVVSTLGVNCGMCQGRQSVIEKEVYALDSKSSNSMKSSNPNSGCHKTEVSKTLDTTVPEPSKNQGGIAIVEIQKDDENSVLF